MLFQNLWSASTMSKKKFQRFNFNTGLYLPWWKLIKLDEIFTNFISTKSNVDKNNKNFGKFRLKFEKYDEILFSKYYLKFSLNKICLYLKWIVKNSVTLKEFGKYSKFNKRFKYSIQNYFHLITQEMVISSTHVIWA